MSSQSSTKETVAQPFLGHFRYPSVQRYIHDLSMEMGEHIDNITATLSMFIEIGKFSDTKVSNLC